MEDFNLLITKLTAAAQSGEIAEVQQLMKDAQKQHYLWQPSPPQAAAISKCVGQLSFEPNEELVKAWMVTSVNEWGGDQERMLLLTTRSVYRVKYDFDSDSMSHNRKTPLTDILRVEFGNYRAAKKSLTTAIWRRELEQQQGLRIYTRDRDGNKSVNDVAREKFGPLVGARPPPAEFYREYRALNAEDEPWREEVFVQELAAAFMAASKLSRPADAENLFEVKPMDLTKDVPGGMFSVLYNSLSLGKNKRGSS